ncbi:MAG: metal ABC transporter substrate-binding protein [Treponema sp.]|nr:metal ABC transporter substrate-binding protein [Treponema sp.]
MKKAILILITIIAVFYGTTGCRQNRTAMAHNKNGKITVITTVFPSYDFVRQIAGDRVNLAMLLPPGAESHSFEPSPKNIIAIQNSDIFIYNGGESEKWVSRILQSMNTENMKIFAMLDAVDIVEEEIVEGMENDENENNDNHKTAYDEHVWTSPKNAILIVKAITDLLCDTDAPNSAYYRERNSLYIEALTQLDNAFDVLVNNAKRKTIIFADRFPFRYFADAYGLFYMAAFPGCSTETEPSAATVAFLINKIRAERIPVVFHIELSNQRMADTISGETGAKKLLLHSCHNITKKDFDSGLGYLDLMNRNVESLREALF